MYKTRGELEQWGRELDGVFCLSDLRVLYRQQSDAGLYKRLAKLVDEGQLIKIKRGVYALPTASLEAICVRINPAAYLSTGTVLGRNLMIGSIPARRIQAIKTGRPRCYTCALGTIEYLSIAPHLFFGFSVTNGMRMATPEKAWIDTCYYTYKGSCFSFDLDTDVYRDQLDKNLLSKYLTAYDKRFRDAFNSTWSKP